MGTWDLDNLCSLRYKGVCVKLWTHFVSSVHTMGQDMQHLGQLCGCALDQALIMPVTGCDIHNLKLVGLLIHDHSGVEF